MKAPRTRGLVLGLSGPICSGKSAVAALMAGLGASHVEVDALGHQALQTIHGPLEARFGPGIFRPGSKEPRVVDRKALGALVFGNPAALADLEALVHPIIQERCRQLVAAFHQSFVTLDQPAPTGTGSESDSQSASPAPSGPLAHVLVLNAAILHRLGLVGLCDQVVWFQAPRVLRWWRLMGRDHLGPLAAWRRLAQLPSRLPQSAPGSADTRIMGACSARRGLDRIQKLLQET